MGIIIEDRPKKKSSFEKKMLLRKISMMDDLPMPNMHVVKVIQLLRREDVNMGELIDAIGRDQSLVAKILKIINSGYYSMRNTIDSVETAINLLGIINLKQIVYSASIMDMFTDDEQEDWNHAYSTMVLMTNLMKENEIPAASNLGLTMLMHDIGKVVLRKFNPKKYKMAREISREKETPIHNVEEDVLQINHAEAAEVLLQKWEMSEDIIKPVSYHHMEFQLPEDYILETALVQFVDWVDCSARSIPCTKPRGDLMKEAGFEGIDGGYWVRYQRDLIAMIEQQKQDAAQG